MQVLIVEDDPVIAMDYEDQVYELGCEVLGPIQSLKEGLQLLEHHTPDAAILDWQLRDETSLMLAKLLLNRDVPFAFVTGQADQVRELLPFEADIVSKPAQIKRLLDGFKRVFSRPSKKGGSATGAT